MSSILSRRKSDNTAAVIEARREIEKIKTELETLINANIKTQSFSAENMSVIVPEIDTLLNTAADVCNNLADAPETSELEAPKMKPPKPVIKTSALCPSPSPNRKKIAPPVTVEETAPQETIRPKLRTYDPEKTREFIKIQKQRRKVKQLEEEQQKQLKEVARKSKLDELKKKTLELVAKNLKKSNSKSAKSPSDVNTNNTSKSNAQIVDSNNKTVNKFLLQSRRCRARSFDYVNRDKESDNNNKRSRSVSKEITPTTNKYSGQPPQQQQQQHQQQQQPENQYQSVGTKSQVTLQSSSQKSLSTSPKSNATTKKPSEKTINETSIRPKENINEIPNPKPETHNQQNKTIDEPKPPETNAAKELSEIKQKLETSITQIKDKNEIPIWLQPPSSVPYPYNFISAVRKKLEYVTRKQPPINQDKTDENNKLNVSIQCSIDKKILDVNSVNIPKLESPKNNRTYESHKCRRQLYVPRKEPTDLINTNEIEINIKKSDSDSDTTKNIPELPHEENKRFNSTSNISLTSNISERLKNITFERNIPPKLNIGDIQLPEPVKYAALIPPDDKIDLSKISKHSKQSSSNSRKSRSKYPDDIDSILSHYSKIKSEQNSYSDDFNSASSKPEEKSESITEYKQIPISLSKSGSISEHLPQTYSNSSSKENIFEGEEKKSSTVSTETYPTMKDVPSLSSKQSDSNQIKTETIASSLNNKSEEKSPEENVKKLIKPEVYLKRRAEEIENNPNHIHLKLQAEVHLLNSFNNSLKQVVAVEKSVFDVPSTSNNANFNPINCTRGCDFTEKLDAKNVAFTNGRPQNGGPTNFKNISDYDSICSQDLGLSNIVDKSSISTTIASHSTTIASNSIISRREENPYVAISLDMVDQMIKDEDIRLEHLKAVLKLRDQALFDRIKGELALLEIRKRELREHGLTNDITAIKKKQRGLIIKLQQERHEMHRLKTAHKQAAKARKTALHEQKSIIKTQLSSTDQIPKKLRRLSHLERPSLGPVKVYRVDSRTEVSETTLSRKGSDDSVTNSSVLTQISEKISVEKSEIFYSDSLAVEPVKPSKQHSLQSEKLKRSLLMKEAEIDKRRKEIEELIKWQKRLKQKEAEVVELERKAAKSLQSDDPENVRVFSGAHLNKVWKGIALPDKNFDEQKKYQMSKRSLDKFYQNARKMFKEVSEEEKRSKTESYSSEFEQSNSVASLNEVEVQTKMVADRLRHISDIISVPVDDDQSSIRTSIKEHAKSTSSEDISSIQEDNKSVSVSISESPSVKTEVNTLVKSDSIHSEFIDSLQNKSPSKSLELIIASEYSSQKPEQTNSIVSESLKTDSLEVIKTNAEISDVSSALEDKPHSRSIISEISEASEKSENVDSLNSSAKSVPEGSVITEKSSSKSQILEYVSEKSEPQVVDNIISDISSAVQSESEASEPPVLENIVSEKSDSIPKSISEATEESDSQIVEKILSEESIPKTVSEAAEPQVISEKSSIKSDSIPKSIPEATEESDSQIVEKIVSEKSTLKTVSETSKPQVLENIVSEKSDSIPKSISEVTEESISQIAENIASEKSTPKTDSEASKPQVLENIVSEKSSVKSDSVPKSIPEVTEESDSQIVEKIVSEKSSPKTDSEALEPQVLENIISEKSSVRSDSVPKSIPEVTEESDSQIVEKIVSEKSSPKTDSEALEQSEPQVLENIISEKSEIKTHDIKSISELEHTPETSGLEITENVASLNSSTKSIADKEQSPEKSELQVQENTDSHNSVSEVSVKSDQSVETEKSKPQEFENIISEISKPENNSFISELDESPEKSTTQPQENRISSEESTWEPQIISEIIKSDSSEKQINSEPETKTRTNSETHISEENLQTDTTTPRSEVQYETDFDKLSESDQSNVSLKETNVDSSLNEDESIKSMKEEENTIKVSPKDQEKSDSANEEISDEDLSDSKKGVSHIDVRKRVSEILADANANGQRGDKSPRVQDLYTTTYDIAGSSESTPESGSPTNEFNKPEKTSLSPETPYINEAEELLRKQLEIEQEIKRLERQQQNIPYLFMREIPNKPPPPYKPPDFPLTPVIASIIPSKPEQTKKIINETTAILFSAYSTGELANTSSKTKDDQQRFMFDLCKEIALEACKPTIETKQPTWKTQKNKFQNLFAKRPITKDYLNSVLNKKVLQLLDFEPVTRNDSLIIRWSRKKRDHVDEILVSETQAEEAEWTNFDSDEEVIKENLTKNILDVLIVDAAKDVNNIFKKKKSFSWVDC